MNLLLRKSSKYACYLSVELQPNELGYTVSITSLPDKKQPKTIYMHQITVDLAISALDYQSYYSGQIKQVVAYTTDGRRVRFPANILQHVVSHEGVYGRFQINFSDKGKFLSIQRFL